MSFELFQIGRSILLDVESRILPQVFGSAQSVIGLALYGSRISGGHRPNSDYDGIVLLDHQGPEAEFHGSCWIEEKLCSVELRFLSFETLSAQIVDEPLYVADRVASALLVYDEYQKFKALKRLAASRIEKGIQDFLTELKAIDAEQEISLIQIAMTEAASILESLDPMAAQLRRSEYIIDFYVAVSKLLLKLELSQRNSLTDGHAARIKNLIFAEGDRGARILNPQRYKLESWFETIYLDLVSATTTSKRENDLMLEVFDRKFRSLFGRALLIPGSLELSAVIKKTGTEV